MCTINAFVTRGMCLQGFAGEGERFEVQGMGFVGTFLKESVCGAKTRFVCMIPWSCIFGEG